MKASLAILLFFTFAANTAFAGNCNKDNEKMSEVQTYESTEKEVISNTTSKNMITSSDHASKKNSKTSLKRDTYGY